MDQSSHLSPVDTPCVIGLLQQQMQLMQAQMSAPPEATPPALPVAAGSAAAAAAASDAGVLGEEFPQFPTNIQGFSAVQVS